MNVQGLELFEDDPRLASAVARATKLLEAELGPSADRVSAEWGRFVDYRGRPGIRLRLSDWTGAIDFDFSPSEFFDESHLEGRFIRIWGDFLQKSSHRLLEPILQSIRENEGR